VVVISYPRCRREIRIDAYSRDPILQLSSTNVFEPALRRFESVHHPLRTIGMRNDRRLGSAAHEEGTEDGKRTVDPHASIKSACEWNEAATDRTGNPEHTHSAARAVATDNACEHTNAADSDAACSAADSNATCSTAGSDDTEVPSSADALGRSRADDTGAACSAAGPLDAAGRASADDTEVPGSMYAGAVPLPTTPKLPVLSRRVAAPVPTTPNVRERMETRTPLCTPVA
jgi:hypothetical protein